MSVLSIENNDLAACSSVVRMHEFFLKNRETEKQRNREGAAAATSEREQQQPLARKSMLAQEASDYYHYCYIAQSESTWRTMKRRAPFADDKDSSDESNGSNSAYEDIVGHSRRVTLQYGVTWELFTKGNSKDDRLQAFRKVKGVLLQPSLTNAAVPASALRCQATVAKWYIGVTFCPAHRWNEEPSPHKHKWDILYVLLLGRDMGRYEKNFLRTINHIPECKARCANVGAGGERCPQSSIKFLYLCVKYTAPPGGGWLQCLREPLDDNESEPEQPLALSDEQPLALSEQPLALSEQPLTLSDEDRLWNTNSVEGCMLDEDRLWTRSA